MSAIATTTNTTPFQFPGETLLARNPIAGTYICLVKGSTADNYLFYRSQDVGATWTLLTTIVRTNLVDLGEIFIDKYNWLFWAYRCNEASADNIYVRRLDTTNGNFNPTGETLFASAGNGGSAGSYYSGVSIRTTYLQSNNFHYIAVAVGTNIGSNQGVTMFAGLVNPSAVLTSANQYISGNRQWLSAGSAGRVGLSMDIEHNGNGYDGTPNLWVAYGRSNLKLVKLPWVGGSWTGGSTAEVTVYSGAGLPSQVNGLWDGSRFIMAIPDPVNTSQVLLFNRDRANSTTSTHRTGNHTTGVVRNCAAAYDPSNGNVRIWAVGTSTAVLYQNDYTRANDTWSGWGSTGLAAILGTNADNYGAKPSSNGDARWGVYTAASGAPNTLTYTPIALSYSPNTPTWVSPSSGAAADVGVSLPLDWAFSDNDPGDTQSAFAMSRQIGAGALSFWRASDSTWQVAEVQNTSSTTILTLASAWALASDANYTYKVKVWDSNNNPSGYSAGMIVVPSTPVNPAITAPTTGQVIGSSQLTVTWTAAEQTRFRTVLTVTSGGQQLYDSGWVGDSVSRSFLIPYVMVTGLALTVTLYTANLEGLSSAAQTKAFTTNFTGPAAPTVTVTPVPASGIMNVAFTNPAPSGAQPAFGTQDLWRRPITTGQTLLNSNPFFETNASGYVTTTGTTFVRSTTQHHEGAAAGFATPDGIQSKCYPESSPTYVFASSTTVMHAQGWIRPTTVNKSAILFIHWYTSGDVFISSSSITVPSVAGAWLFMSLDALPVPTAAKASCALGLTSTPAVGDTFYVDELILSLSDPNLGVRVATGLATGVTYPDWKAVGGISYEYQALVSGTTGVVSYGAWTA